eukprot:INCI19248.1.p1 GENE.INCI19248.1~~INCI19248.1.p1  ORF type:complete len:260 (-),score=31.35 INCI19248.1:983-1762(-)
MLIVQLGLPLLCVASSGVEELRAEISLLVERVSKQESLIQQQQAILQHLVANQSTEARRGLVSSESCAPPAGPQLFVDGICSCVGDVIVGNRSVSAELDKLPQLNASLLTKLDALQATVNSLVTQEQLNKVNASLSDASSEVSGVISGMQLELLSNTYNNAQSYQTRYLPTSGTDTGCGDYYYSQKFHDEYFLCTPCAEGCKICSSSRADCSECSGLYYLHENSCALSCPEGYVKTVGAIRTCEVGTPVPAPIMEPSPG